MKSIIEESGIEAIDTEDDGTVWGQSAHIDTSMWLYNYFSIGIQWITLLWPLQVKITAKDLSSLERSKAIISNLTMVPTIGDIYR